MGILKTHVNGLLINTSLKSMATNKNTTEEIKSFQLLSGKEYMHIYFYKTSFLS